MRRAALAILAFAFLGCKPPPQDKMLSAFVKELELHFANQNNDQLMRFNLVQPQLPGGQKQEPWTRRDVVTKQEEARSKNPTLPPPLGTQYNSFHWNEKGFIAWNVRCRKATCKTVYLVVDYYGTAKNCSRCGDVLIKARPKEEGNVGAWLAKEYEATVKPMFEPTQKDTSKMPMKAIVRYIRRNWSYDGRGRADIDTTRIPESSKWKAEIKTGYLPGVEGGRPMGFHRQDTVWVAEQEFEFTGTELKPVGMPKETAVAPWTELYDISAELQSSN